MNLGTKSPLEERGQGFILRPSTRYQGFTKRSEYPRDRKNTKRSLSKPAVQVDKSRRFRRSRDHVSGEAQLVHHRQSFGRRQDGLRTRLDEEVIDAVARDHTARTFLHLQNEDVQTGPTELPRTGQPGDSGPYYNYIRHEILVRGLHRFRRLGKVIKFTSPCGCHPAQTPDLGLRTLDFGPWTPLPHPPEPFRQSREVRG